MIHMKIGLPSFCESSRACERFVRQGIDSHFSSEGLGAISAIRASRSEPETTKASSASITSFKRKYGALSSSSSIESKKRRSRLTGRSAQESVDLNLLSSAESDQTGQGDADRNESGRLGNCPQDSVAEVPSTGTKIGRGRFGIGSIKEA